MTRPFRWLLAGIAVNSAGDFIPVFLVLYLVDDAGLSVTQAGALLTVRAVAAAIGPWIGGQLSDRYDPRLVASCAFAASAAGISGLLVTDGLVSAASALVLQGVASTTSKPAVASLVAALLPAELWARGYTLTHWAYNLGSAGGTAAAGVVAGAGLGPILAADAATSAVFAVVLLLTVPAVHHSQPRASRPRSHRPERPSGLEWSIAWWALVQRLAYVQTSVVLPLAIAAADLPVSTVAWVWTLNTVLVAAITPLTGRLSTSVRPMRRLALGCLVIGAGLGSTALANSLAAYLATTAVWTGGEIIVSGAALAAMAAHAPARRLGRAQGLLLTADQGVGKAAGTAGGTALAAAAGPASVWLACLALDIAAGAGWYHLDRRCRARGSRQVERESRPEPSPADAGGEPRSRADRAAGDHSTS
ncbi:MAG: MFS transporter [Dermatophilaceae bacterium]